MMNQGLHNISECPSVDQIRAVLSGVSDAPSWDAMEAHLANCSSCEATLDAIAEQSDTCIRELCRRPSTADDEPVFQQLYEKLIASPNLAAHGDSPTFSFDLPHALGHYELLRALGHGANGNVFEARHVPLDRLVVIKLLRPDLDFDSGSVERFVQEMRAIGRLDHPNIARATDAGETDGQHFLVMEHVPGIDVSSLLTNSGPLSTNDACEIVRQAATGLAYLHQQGFVHRDVKPSNLLLTGSACVKLLDLGLVQSVRDTIATDTATGQLPHGTADYMSPEQWQTFNQVDARSDLYSLGCTLVKLLTGSPPYRPIPKGFETKSEAHRLAPVVDLTQKPPFVSDALQSCLERLLAKEPYQRFTSAEEVVAAMHDLTKGADLSRLAMAAGLEACQPTASTSNSTPAISRRHAIALSAVSVLCVATSLPALRRRLNRPAAPDSLDTATWRTLQPSTPALLLPLDDKVENEWSSNAPDTFSVHSRRQTLLSFGRPISPSFRLAVDLQFPFSHDRAGLFYQYVRENWGDGAQRFQTVEIEPARGGDLDSIRLTWSLVRFHPESRKSSRVLLGESHLDLAPGNPAEGVHTLELTMRADSEPAASFFGNRIKWRLTDDGRAALLDGVRMQKLGFLGVIADNAKSSVTDDSLDTADADDSFRTTFLRPRLCYAQPKDTN